MEGRFSVLKELNVSLAMIEDVVMLRFAKQVILTSLAVVFALTFVSCDDKMFESEGDCEVTHVVRFRYDLNLKWADAFPSEVNSVHLYVFDSNGVFVKEYLGRGEDLTSPDYCIALDLPVGDYKFVAWCGLENDGVEMKSFTVPQPVAGVTMIEELTCALNTKRAALRSSEDDTIEYSDERLNFLYHGYMEVSIVDDHDGQTFEHVMYLTKNTNHVRIILQELTGDGMDKNDYEFTIEDANGFMEYNNELRGSSVVTYKPWNQDSDELGVGKDEAETGLQYVRGVYADLTLGRMMASHKNDMMLTIRNTKTQKVIARVPILQYALLSKDYYEEAYKHKMVNDQEFLDREDEYVLTFFLKGGEWEKSVILIHSWRVVLHDYDLGA